MKNRWIVVAAIVGVRPFERLPAALAVRERDLGVDAVAEIDAMGMILGRRQHQLGGRDVAGIEIERPRLGMSAECRHTRLPSRWSAA